MQMRVVQPSVAEPKETASRRSRWGITAYWGMHAWILAYCLVLIGAFFVQFGKGEFPCPLCMLQRYAMFLASLGALYVVMHARRGTLTAGLYGQGLGMGLIGALAGAAVSMRHILLHIEPGDNGYGSPVFGLHLYTWALLTYAIVAIYCGVMLMLMPSGLPSAPAEGNRLSESISKGIIGLFIAVMVANLVVIVALEGFAIALPGDPTSYHLIDQLTSG